MLGLAVAVVFGNAPLLEKCLVVGIDSIEKVSSGVGKSVDRIPMLADFRRSEHFFRYRRNHDHLLRLRLTLHLGTGTELKL
jgi:hypothetical protein